MREFIVLAMHGAPPRDFPRNETAEFFGLNARLRQTTGEERAALERRRAELESRMRSWPRTPQNDPFYTAAQELARQLSRAAGQDVVVGFNEFCAPTLEDALDHAAERAERVTVATPMMTRGGEHSEVEIPAAVGKARERHPRVQFRYVWPLDVSEVARFLADQISRFA